MITRWQSIEYIISNCLTEEPSIISIGRCFEAIGAFKRNQQAGGFTTDTLAEDCDLTICIPRFGYIRQKLYLLLSLIPKHRKPLPQFFFKQRFRWSFGNTMF